MPRSDEPQLVPLGIRGRTNLDQQDPKWVAKGHDGSSKPMTAENPRIQALFIYPLKSCRAVELSTADVIRSGFKYDRLFTFAKLVGKDRSTSPPSRNGHSHSIESSRIPKWEFVTQRELPRLALLHTELWIPARQCREAEIGRTRFPLNEARPDHSGDWAANGGYLIVRFPYHAEDGARSPSMETVSFRIPLEPVAQRSKTKGYTYESVSIWIDQLEAINMTTEIEPAVLIKLQAFLGAKNQLGLFRSDDKNLRTIIRSLPPNCPDENFSVGFADAFPLHLLNVASVSAIDDELPTNAAAKGKLDALRFRANIYISGAPAYAEDTWKTIRFGNAWMPDVEGHPANYHVASRIARCKLPNVDQATGVKDRNEPDTTLRRTRKVDAGAYPHPCLGMALMPLFQQGCVRVGDPIEVLAVGDHYYEKMFK